MSRALRVSVPLNSRCSRKWLTPREAPAARRATRCPPRPRRWPTGRRASRSVTTRSPLSRPVRRTPSDRRGADGPDAVAPGRVLRTMRLNERAVGSSTAAAATTTAAVARHRGRRRHGRARALPSAGTEVAELRRASASNASSNDATSTSPAGAAASVDSARPRSPTLDRRSLTHGHRRGHARRPPPLRRSRPSAPRSGERDLAVRVDVVDPDLDLVAEVEHVLDPVDALAADRAWRCGAGRRGPGGC